MKIGDLVSVQVLRVRRFRGGKWIESGDVGILVGFDFANSPRVLLGKEVHTFTRESVVVLSPSIKATPGGISARV